MIRTKSLCAGLLSGALIAAFLAGGFVPLAKAFLGI